MASDVPPNDEEQHLAALEVFEEFDRDGDRSGRVTLSTLIHLNRPASRFASMLESLRH
jgi:hypothetical protein